mmetsp:Transcript_22919/g.52541  ORF Transcript_22919/g.52541 Transcript_22919/m.52541 type:complete len:305 (+) Transcript_22919:52-966(+)
MALSWMPPTFVEISNRFLSGLLPSAASGSAGQQECPQDDLQATLYRQANSDAQYATALQEQEDADAALAQNREATRGPSEDSLLARRLQYEENERGGMYDTIEIQGPRRPVQPVVALDPSRILQDSLGGRPVPSEDTLFARRLQNEENQRAGVNLHPGAEFRRAFGSSHDAQEPQHDRSETRECKICMAAPVSTRFKPCYHAICCNSCAARLQSTQCPICRQTITDWDNGTFTSTLAKPSSALPRWPDSMPAEELQRIQDRVARGRGRYRRGRVALAHAVDGAGSRVRAVMPRRGSRRPSVVTE